MTIRMTARIILLESKGIANLLTCISSTPPASRRRCVKFISAPPPQNSGAASMSIHKSETERRRVDNNFTFKKDEEIFRIATCLYLDANDISYLLYF